MSELIPKKFLVHPMQGMTFDLLEFWLSKVPEYERSPKYHDKVHKALIEPRYGAKGEFMPTMVVLSGGEQSGKSKTSGAHVFGMHWHSKIIWMVGERYEDTRKEFEYMMAAGFATGALDPKNVSFPQTPGPARATFNNGCMVRTLSSADVTTLSQESPDGILMVEAGRQSYAAFRVLWGRALHHSAWFLVSGCIVGDSYMWTDRGLIRIDSLQSQIVPHPEDLGVDGGTVDLVWRNLPQPTIKITTKYGFELEGTEDHALQIMDKDGLLTWKRLDELEIDDTVCIRHSSGKWGNNDISTDTAYMSGLYIAEGCVDRNDRFTITNSDPEIEEYLYEHGFKKQSNSYHWRKTDHKLAAKLHDIGIDPTWKARTKQVPNGILTGKKEVVRAFLQGLFDGDGCAHKNGYVKLATSSRILARQVQQLLLNFGIVAALSSKIDHLNGKEFVSYCLNCSTWSPIFYEQIGFRIARKQERETLMFRKVYFNKSVRRIVLPEHIDMVYGPRNRNTDGTYATGRIYTYDSEWENVVLVPVKTIETGFKETFDVRVPISHKYVANGLIVHNTFEQYKGRWFPDLWRSCQTDNEFLGISISFPTYVNPVNYPLGENDPKVQAARATMSEEEFSERFMGEPRAPIGVVFPEFRRQIHVKAKSEYEKAYPVTLWIDPGYNPSSYAVLFVQIVHDQVRIFDEIYVNDLENAQVADMVKHHYAYPNITKIVIDVAAQAHAGAQQPAVVAWQDAMRGRGVVIRGQYVKVIDGINKTHDYLNMNPLTSEPYMIIHPRCESTISEFEEGYRRHVGKAGDVRTGMPIDKDNHSSKAIAYGLVDEFGFSQNLKIERLKPTFHRSSYANVYNRR